MKMTRFFVVASALVAFSVSQISAQITISNHADITTVDAGTGLACAAGGVSADNNYFQVFDLAAQGVVGDYTVATVIIGMDAIQENFGLGGTIDGEIPADVHFYWTSPLAAISVDVNGPAGAVPDASCATFIPVPPDGLQLNEVILEMDCPGVTIPGSASTLVVHVFYPDSTAAAGGNTDLQFHGGNSSGPAGFLASAGCGITTPTDPGAIGFPASNFLIALTEDTSGGGGGPCTNPLGDVNLDGMVTLADVSPFVAILTSGGFQCEADINEDGVVSLADVNPFVNILTGG